MDSVKLADKTFEELNNLRLAIEMNPANKNTNGGWDLHTAPARKKLDDIAWAITNKMQRQRDNA